MAAMLCLGVGLQSTRAARGWCLADPVIMVDGQLADVFVTSDPAMLLSARGPIQLVVEIPTGSRGMLVLADLGFGRGYRVSFVESDDLARTAYHTQVRVNVYAPASKSLPVQVTFAPRTLSAGLRAILIGTTAEGTANAWIGLTTP
jgi:hypothetical protein